MDNPQGERMKLYAVIGLSVVAALMAYFRFFFSSWGVTSPIFVRKKMTTGSSNTAPNAKSSLMEKEKYCLTEGSALTYSLANFIKNLNPKGKTTKYPNSAPPTKRTVEVTTNGMTYFFSF